VTKPRRYYSAEPIEGKHVLLYGSEAHHLLHVMRAAPGEHIVLFDGQGGQHDAKVVACERKTVQLTVGMRQPDEHELPFRLTIGMPLPKGDRQRFLVDKLVELGVSRLVPLITARSTLKDENRTSTKLASYVIGATKQCGRNTLMEIDVSLPWKKWTQQEAPRQLIAHSNGQPWREVDLSKSEDTQIAIGPEGGFTDEELVQAVDQGWQAVTLGPRTLRMETAAMVLAAAVGLWGGSRQQICSQMGQPFTILGGEERIQD
jgi:16S rRNA (uracil1498-N3)-methyltransferase